MNLLGRFLRPLADVLQLGLEAGTAIGILAIGAMVSREDDPRDGPRLHRHPRQRVPSSNPVPPDRRAGRTSD